MIEIKQTETYFKWEHKLKDQRAKAAIAARVFRLANGLLGDVSPVGQGISELRIHYGPGYRIYFKQNGNEIVILLCGGDKSTQSKDIETAKKLAKELGDVSPVGQGISELRIHYGPGYRIYFKQNGNEIVILLCGGDKSTQSKDIETAKKLAKELGD